MSSHEPTLKVRFDMGSTNPLGISCDHLAAEIAKAARQSGTRFITELQAVSSKWSHPYDVWLEKGGGWGTPDLTDREKGFIDAVTLSNDDPVVTKLLSIIDRLTK